MVFVHGALGDHRSWTPQVRAISPHYRFTAYSRRHHYPASWDPGGPPYSYLQHADDLAEVIRGTGPEPVHLVGHSYGSAVALLLAVREPGLLRSLAVSEPAATAMLPPGLAPAPTDPLAPYQQVLGAIEAGDHIQAVRAFMSLVNGDPDAFDRFPPSTKAVLLANAGTLGPMLTGSGPLPISREALRGLRIPTLLIESARSTPSFRAVLDYLAASLPDREQVTIPDSSHGLTYQNPTVYNAALVDFLDRH